MATLIPTIGSARFDSAGELRLAERLKEFEFPCVAVNGLGALGRRDATIEDDVRLTYVAITRATHEAFLTYSRASPLVARLVA